MADLGTVLGSPVDYRATGVSNDGSTVVGFSFGGPGNPRAFRWTSAGGIRDLQGVFVNDYGLSGQLAGWELLDTFGCSPNGLFLVGDGAGPSQQAWIARLDAPPSVTATQVNDGSIQRSRVTSLSVTFDTPVSFAGTVAQAFTLTRVSDNAPVSFAANATIIGGVTVVTLNTFDGSATNFGSLADGRYMLTALAAQIRAGGQQMTSNYTFGDAQGLFRFFGDINGDRHVNIADYGLFSLSYLNPGNYVAGFDFNGDGRINIYDLGMFSLRYLAQLP